MCFAVACGVPADAGQPAADLSTLSLTAGIQQHHIHALLVYVHTVVYTYVYRELLVLHVHALLRALSMCFAPLLTPSLAAELHYQ
jgi:hypothetical protein